MWDSGEACVALAAFLFSLSSLFVKLGAGRLLSVFAVCAFSSGGCAIILLLAAACTGTRLLPAQVSSGPCSARRVHALVAARALLGAATMICYYRAVSLVSIKDATALFFTSPMLTLVFDHVRQVSKKRLSCTLNRRQLFSSSLCACPHTHFSRLRLSAKVPGLRGMQRNSGG